MIGNEPIVSIVRECNRVSGEEILFPDSLSLVSFFLWLRRGRVEMTYEQKFEPKIGTYSLTFLFTCKLNRIIEICNPNLGRWKNFLLI